MKVLRKIIEIDEQRCDGCGQCMLACAEGAIGMVDGKARLLSESYCDGLGACIGECPQGAISVVEREAEDFDPEAVHRHIESQQETKRSQYKAKQSEDTLPCGCPSTYTCISPSSPIKNWPVKIRLVPPQAPFLEESHIFIVADCCPAICYDFHQRFLNPEGANILLIGCPKFDNLNEYMEKFVAIIRNHPSIREITVIRMEVPCCSGLMGAVKKAVEAAAGKVNVREVVLSARGDVIQGFSVSSVA